MTVRFARARYKCALFTVAVAILAFAVPQAAESGPPFVTDDPEPVAPRHMEIYTGYTVAGAQDGRTGTLPFLELNWGPRRNVQLSLTVPRAYSMQNGEWASGLGDLEVGVKVRFVPESRTLPQVALYPVATLPTGDPSRKLGDGATATFLPLWAEKHLGAITVYGGGGVWNRGGASPARWSQMGIAVEAALSEHVMLGAETYRIGARRFNEPSYTAVAFGASAGIGEHRRVLLSFGRSTRGAPQNTVYAAIETLVGQR